LGDQDVEIFSSDLLRASQTADAIARRFRLAAILMSDLREMSYGDAEGRPRQWLLSRQTPAPHDNRLDDRGGIENAETRREFAARIYRAVDAIVRRPCSTQIIVTHGFALSFVVAAWIKMPIEALGYIDFRVSPGSITHLREDEFWLSRTVLALGDVSHFREATSLRET
jgi:probable phosphoglycerate mutase